MSSITYIVQLESPDAFVKFGKTSAPRKRISQLSVGTPWPVNLVCLIGSDVESDLKRIFAKDKVRGEWFRPTQELEDWIAAAADEGRLTKQVEVNQAYINAAIKPRILEYLNGREPANNIPGDLVARILADTLPSLEGRELELSKATKGHVTVQLSKGFGPTNERGTLIIPREGITAHPAFATGEA